MHGRSFYGPYLEVEEKFTKVLDERREAIRILLFDKYATFFCNEFKQNCHQNAKLGSAKSLNFGSWFQG